MCVAKKHFVEKGNKETQGDARRWSFQQLCGTRVAKALQAGENNLLSEGACAPGPSPIGPMGTPFCNGDQEIMHYGSVNKK